MESNKELIEIKNFTLDFFQRLECNISWEKDVLVIKGISKDFEEFSGRNGPFFLVFEKDKGNANTELITSGSQLLKLMRDYLDRKGETTLLKVVIEIDPVKEILERMKFYNCNISRVIQKKEYNILTRFTFSSIFQYLNEKERFLNYIYLDNGKIVDFDISKYRVIEGRKDEIKFGNVKSEYDIAREQLKKLLTKTTEEVSEKISEKLEREINRIKEHYARQTKEKEDQIFAIEKQIRKAEEQMIKSSEKDKDSLKAKIDRFKENIQIIEKSDYKSRTKKEEEFLINDEIRKHGLNISNKLINTSIIYYPSFLLEVSLTNGEIKGNVSVKLNPHTKAFDFPLCRSCNEAVKNAYLCSSGHLSCKECLDKCPSCDRLYCKHCLSRKCDVCRNNICIKCSVRCQSCGNHLCLLHVKQSSSGDKLCSSCILRCRACGNLFSKKTLQKCPSCKSDFCDKCTKKEFIKIGQKVYCSNCSKRCDACKKIFHRDNFQRLRTCECDSCNSLERCLSCKKILCKKVRKQF